MEVDATVIVVGVLFQQLEQFVVMKCGIRGLGCAGPVTPDW